MNILKNLLYLILTFLPHFTIANHYSSIDYRIAPVTGDGVPAINVQTEIKGRMSGKVALDLPDEWASASYVEQIKNIKLTNPNYKFRIDRKKGHKIIITLPKATDYIGMSYDIYQTPSDPSDVHHTIIRKNLVHSTGYGLFATPVDLKNTNELPFSITWYKFSDNWKAMSSFGSSKYIKFTTIPSQLLHIS